MTNRQRIARLERIIACGVMGMDPDDTIGSVKVLYADGSTRWLVDVAKELAELQADRCNDCGEALAKSDIKQGFETCKGCAAVRREVAWNSGGKR